MFFESQEVGLIYFPDLFSKFQTWRFFCFENFQKTQRTQAFFDSENFQKSGSQGNNKIKAPPNTGFLTYVFYLCSR
jgi:hypothetical protein